MCFDCCKTCGWWGDHRRTAAKLRMSHFCRRWLVCPLDPFLSSVPSCCTIKRNSNSSIASLDDTVSRCHGIHPHCTHITLNVKKRPQSITPKSQPGSLLHRWFREAGTHTHSHTPLQPQSLPLNGVFSPTGFTGAAGRRRRSRLSWLCLWTLISG